ncbi:MAG: class IV adenylate cyclase [Candidatus Nanoarchaeia archaeon]|nr:class IV adenylate cyclase [Candidatus Nanoarchaeia archaeon]MDD5587824.1 class IV adenylate cyclase [Candidatus Nanoarchaeia archaeon]
MLEIEAKIKISEEEKENLIKKLGKPKFYKQENVFFGLEDKIIRHRTLDNGILLTIKGKNEPCDFNKREETEIELPYNHEVIKLLFEVIGLKKLLTYEKQRANYKINRCTVSLDILTIGNYVEIEGQEEDISKTINFLGLEKYPIEKRSYFEMLGGENGLH